MAKSCYFGFLILCILGIIVGSVHAQLKMNFYAQTCPKAEKLVEEYVKEHIPNAPSLAAALLRLHFHDCFVRGCDASVLLNFTSATKNHTEKTAEPNLSLRGFGFIDGIKRIVEKECPGIVSCADILALAARDSVLVIGGPYWNVPTGRRDGRRSNATEALYNLPPPFGNFTIVRAHFANKGLDLKDLVLLSGAHTISISHCSSFSERLYYFNGVWGTQDPSLDIEYATVLKERKCKSINDTTTIAEMDPGSFRTFDLSYYKMVLKRRGLFQSDAALLTNPTTKLFVNKLAKGSLQDFYAKFAMSMEKLGRIEVKTGSDGEIRKHCAVVN